MSDLLRFDHLALPVFDAAATYRFYGEVLQLPLVDALSGDDWGGRRACASTASPLPRRTTAGSTRCTSPIPTASFSR